MILQVAELYWTKYSSRKKADRPIVLFSLQIQAKCMCILR